MENNEENDQSAGDPAGAGGAEPEKGGNYRFLLYLVPVAALLTWPVVRWVMKANKGEMNLSQEEYSAFNTQEGEIQKEAAASRTPDFDERIMGVRYKSKAQQEREARLAAEARANRAAAGREGPAGTQAAGRSKDRSGTTEEQRRHEEEFLRRHDAEIKKYQQYLAALGEKYRRKYPAVNQMDAEFAGMSRYMALKEQYARDRNAYNWARGAMALPEVRNALARYCSNVDVLSALIGASLEALKSPPPPSIYNEMLNFFTSDSKMAPHVQDLGLKVSGNLAATLPYAIPQGADITPLQNLGTQIAGGHRPPAKR